MSDLLLTLAVALAACVQATAGMGFALILSPVLLVVLAPTSAIVLVTALSLTLNLLVLFRSDHRPDVAWAEVAPMLAAAIPGSICGLLVLRALPKPALEIGVGTTVVALTLVRLLPRAWVRSPSTRRPPPRTRAQMPTPPRSGSGRRLAVGALAGALATTSGVNGPPLALWLSARPLSVTIVRDSLAACFLGMGAITALTLMPTLGSVHLQALVLCCCIVAVVAGHAAGSRLHPRIRAERVQRLLVMIILASGLSALAFGIAAL